MTSYKEQWDLRLWKWLKERDATYQLGKNVSTTGSHKEHLKARSPQLKRRRLHETFCADAFFASTKALTGESCVQFFVGQSSKLTYTYSMKSESKGASILEKHIKEVGGLSGIKSDNSKIQAGRRFAELCSLRSIGQETTEPYHQCQNETERRIQTVKEVSNRIMDRTGAPNSLWLRAVCFTCMPLNIMACKSLDWRTPM